VIDAIKLLEAGWKPLCDAIWVVTCTPEQQVERLVATRGLSVAEAQARIAAQPPQADKVAQADVVIDNSGSLDATRRQVEAAWRDIDAQISPSPAPDAIRNEQDG
jgi:dephospho-CoA kinase